MTAYEDLMYELEEGEVVEAIVFGHLINGMPILSGSLTIRALAASASPPCSM